MIYIKMGEKSSTTNLRSLKEHAELLRDIQDVKESDIPPIIGEDAYKELYPKEDSPKPSRSSHAKKREEDLQTNQRVHEEIYGPIEKAEEDLFLDVFALRNTVHRLRTQGIADDVIIDQVGLREWNILVERKLISIAKKEEKKKKILQFWKKARD